MNKRIGWLTVAAVALAPATAAEAKIFASTDTKAMANVFLRHSDLKSSAFDSDFVVLAPRGNPTGYSNGKIAHFPRRGTHFAMLSTGNVRFADHKNVSTSTSFNNQGPLLRGTRDLAMWRLQFAVPKGRNCLSFSFKFLSDEFPEFVDSQFNDAFIAELDQSTWDSPREDPTIDAAPDNFAKDSEGNRISVNAVGDAAVAAKYARGTTYDAATRTLRASTPVTSGRHSLYLSIFDQGDRQYDSTVFLDRLRFKRDASCETGVVLDT